MAKITIFKDRCKACYYCIHFCPKKCLGIDNTFNVTGYHPATVLTEKNDTTENCSGCGFCYLVCPETCIEVWK